MRSSLGDRPRNSSGKRNVTALAIRTGSVNDSIAEAFRQWSAKFIAKRLEVSDRTVENWQSGCTGPQVKHVAAILHDPILRPEFLKALGLAELADLDRARSHLMAAKAALAEIGE